MVKISVFLVVYSMKSIWEFKLPHSIREPIAGTMLLQSTANLKSLSEIKIIDYIGW